MVIALLVNVASAADHAWIELVREGELSDRWETKGNWRVGNDGVVTLEPRPGEQGWRRFEHYIWSDDEFADFEIEFDYRVQRQGNSGFFFHVGSKKDPVKQGIEVQIFDSFGKPDKSNLTDHDSGGIIPGIPPTKNPARRAGEWNQFQVRVARKRLTVKLNGQVVNQIDLAHPNIKDRPKRGYIGFQDHGMPLSLRNVRVRRL